MLPKPKIFTNFAWAFIGKWGNEVINLVTFGILAYLLDPKAFGLLAIINTILVISKIFANQGFPLALIQKSEITNQHINAAFWATLFIANILATIIFFLSTTISSFFQEPMLVNLIKVSCCTIILIPLYSIAKSLLHRNLHFKLLTNYSFLANMIANIIAIIAAYFGWGVWSLIIKRIIETLIATFLFVRYLKWYPSFQINIDCLRELLSFGSQVLSVNLLNNFKKQTLELLIGYYFSLVTLGYYKIADRVCTAIDSIFTNTVAVVMFPIFAKAQTEKRTLKKLMLTCTGVFAYFLLPIYIFLFVFSYEIVMIIFGDKWLDTVNIIKVLILYAFINFLYRLNYIMLITINKISVRLKLDIAQFFTVIACFFILKENGIIPTIVAMIVILSSVLVYENIIISDYLSIKKRLFYLKLLQAILPNTIILIITLYFVNAANITNIYPKLAISTLVFSIPYLGYTYIRYKKEFQEIFTMIKK